MTRDRNKIENAMTQHSPVSQRNEIIGLEPGSAAERIPYPYNQQQLQHSDGRDHRTERKRRQRSKSSPELYQASATNSRQDYPFPIATENLAGRPSSTGSARRMSYNTPDSASSSYPPAGNMGRSGEDTVTLRRREANRLAAQRFRSRKKGYQDSLEERIRVLEDERDVLLRRLGEHPESIVRLDDDPYVRYPSYAPPNRRPPSFSGPSESPDNNGPVDVEVRVASLESANRRLQDELRGVYEENERLLEELDYWHRRDRDGRQDGARRVEDGHHPPSRLPPLDSGLFATNNSTNHRTQSPYHPSPVLPSHPPLERARSYAHPLPHNSTTPRPLSPSFRLPPLRLPPLPNAVPESRTLPSPSLMNLAAGDPFFPAPSPRSTAPLDLPERERRQPPTE